VRAKASMPKHLTLVIKIAIAMFVLASLILVGVDHYYSMPFSKVTRSSVIFIIALDAILFLAGVSFIVFLLRMRLKLKPGWEDWLLGLSLIFYVVGVSPHVLLGIMDLEVFYPPVHVFFSDSHELKYLYGKCQTIKKGQTIDEVRAIMSEFQIAEQHPTDLYFNTPNLGNYACGVHLSNEAVPHVVSIDFILD